LRKQRFRLRQEILESNRILSYFRPRLCRRHKKAEAMIGTGVQQKIKIFLSECIAHVSSLLIAESNLK
jgi:hypothetical protein